jgi:hypothetical protein
LLEDDTVLTTREESFVEGVSLEVSDAAGYVEDADEIGGLFDNGILLKFKGRVIAW